MRISCSIVVALVKLSVAFQKTTNKQKVLRSILEMVEIPSGDIATYFGGICT